MNLQNNIIKLSPEQIDRLYQFTRQHYVEYYDLQIELVDHLANAIEEQCAINPKVDFETALSIEFTKFGVMGFTGIVDKRKYELENKYEIIVKDYFKPLWRMPWLLVLIGSVLLFPCFFDTSILVIITAFLALVDISIGFLKWIYRMFEKTKKEKSKKWLFKEILYRYRPARLPYLAYYFFYKLILGNQKITENIPEYTLSLVVSIFSIYFAINIIVVRIMIPLKAKEYLKQTYPEYGLVK